MKIVKTMEIFDVLEKYISEIDKNEQRFRYIVKLQITNFNRFMSRTKYFNAIKIVVSKQRAICKFIWKWFKFEKSWLYWINWNQNCTFKSASIWPRYKSSFMVGIVTIWSTNWEVGLYRNVTTSEIHGVILYILLLI